MRLGVALAALVLAAGCGGDGDDLQQAHDAVSDYVTAIAEGDGARACGRMTERTQEQFTEDEPQAGSCEEAVQRVRDQLSDEDLAPLRDPRIEVTLNRDKATASVQDGPSDLTVIKVGGRWLIDAD